MRLPSPLSDEIETVVRRVIGCAIAVHRELGPGFLESIYTRAMYIALTKAGMAYESEKIVTSCMKALQFQVSAWT